MSELNELLWTLCRKLPTDFTPYGDRDRDTAEPCADCSCGCRHFVPFAGEPGNDWGVCANPKSPRAGLLTFEHQGCPQFEAEDEIAMPDTTAIPSGTAPAVQENDSDTSPPDAPLKRLKIDFEELAFALEGFGTQNSEHFLDTETGEVLELHDDFDDGGEIRERIESDLSERYRTIETLESHESFRIMENFAASLPESQLRARLLNAITRNKPFRHFKDIVHSDLALRDQWFAFQENALAEYVRDWLASLGIEADLQRRQK